MKWYLVDVVEDGVATNKLIQASSFEEALENIEEQVGKKQWQKANMVLKIPQN